MAKVHTKMFGVTYYTGTEEPQIQVFSIKFVQNAAANNNVIHRNYMVNE